MPQAAHTGEGEDRVFTGRETSVICAVMTTSSKRDPRVWTRRRRPLGRKQAAPSVTVGLLAAVFFATPAWASPGSESPANPAVGGVNLRLDSRTARRLLAETGSGASPNGDAAGSDKTRADETAGEKTDEPKLTVTTADKAAKKPSPGSEDSLAFLKDWPFWAIVGGVVIVGAATYMIVQNHNQKHACSAIYDAGCFGAK